MMKTHDWFKILGIIGLLAAPVFGWSQKAHAMACDMALTAEGETDHGRKTDILLDLPAGRFHFDSALDGALVKNSPNGLLIEEEKGTGKLIITIGTRRFSDADGDKVTSRYNAGYFTYTIVSGNTTYEIEVLYGGEGGVSTAKLKEFLGPEIAGFQGVSEAHRNREEAPIEPFARKTQPVWPTLRLKELQDPRFFGKGLNATRYSELRVEAVNGDPSDLVIVVGNRRFSSWESDQAIVTPAATIGFDKALGIENETYSLFLRMVPGRIGEPTRAYLSGYRKSTGGAAVMGAGQREAEPIAVFEGPSVWF